MTFPYTELGNAERLVARHGRDLKFVPQWGPLAWDGRRWVRDMTGEFARRAKETVRAMHSDALQLPIDDARRAMIKWAMASESARAINAMIQLAQTEREIAAVPEMFNAKPFLLTVANGTLNLETMELQPHRREDLITKLAPVAYDPDAVCPTWEKFVLDIMAKRHEMVGFLKRAIGYSLTGDTREQKLLFLHGDGSNGKGTLTRTLEKLLGDYYEQAEFASFLEHHKNAGAASPDIARLAGARFVAASETGDVQRVDEGLLKSLTGQDTIPARLLYHEVFAFRPAFKLWLIANAKPPIRGTDYGIWRRLLLVPFDVTFTEETIDHGLEAALRGPELSGILRWCVEGCTEWQEKGLAAPDAVRQATANYRDEQDTLAWFLADQCELDAKADESASALLARLNAGLSRAEQFSVHRLRAGLTRRGFKSARNARGVRWIGLRLRVLSASDVEDVGDSTKASTRARMGVLEESATQPTQPALSLVEAG